MYLGESWPARFGARTYGTSGHALAHRDTSNLMSDFVICINNDSNPASLLVGKVYRTRPDSDAEGHQMLRVVDEDKSEPDGYLYPASMFAPIELPEVAERALMTTSD